MRDPCQSWATNLYFTPSPVSWTQDNKTAYSAIFSPIVDKNHSTPPPTPEFSRAHASRKISSRGMRHSWPPPQGQRLRVWATQAGGGLSDFKKCLETAWRSNQYWAFEKLYFKHKKNGTLEKTTTIVYVFWIFFYNFTAPKYLI